jgi:hypothetical protein
MATNKAFRSGPVAITNAVANILNPPTISGGVNAVATATYLIIRHIRIVNKTAGAVTISSWIGATGGSAAGTEFAWQGTSVPANSFLDWYGALRMDVADFMTMEASASTSLSFEAEGEIGID